MRGLAAPFVARRMGSSWLLLGCILLTTAITAALIAALTSFWVQALAQAADGQLARSAGMSIVISGQVNARTAAADEPVVRGTMHTVFGHIPYRLDGALWSDSLGLTVPGQGAPGPHIRRSGAGGGGAALAAAGAADHRDRAGPRPSRHGYLAGQPGLHVP